MPGRFAPIGHQLLKHKARWLYPLAGLILYALAGFLLAPWLLDRTLRSTLAERLDLETRLASVRINPFALTLTMEDLAISEADGAPLFGFDRLLINFELVSLFRWAWSFDEVHLAGPALRFERFTDNDNNFSRLATLWQASVAPAQPPVGQADDGTAAGLPRLVIADLRVTDGRLTVTDRVPGEDFVTNLAPIDLAMAHLSTLPDTSGDQQVTIRTESGASVSWTGKLSVNPLALSGLVTVQGTYTPMLFRYFRDRLQLPVTFDGGELNARLNYAIALDAGSNLSVAISNVNGTLSGLAVNQPDHSHLVELGSLKINGGSLRWPEMIAHIDEILLDTVAIDAYRDGLGRYLPTEGSASSGVTAEIPSAGADAKAPAGKQAWYAGGWQLSAGSLRLSDWRLSHTDTDLDSARVVVSRMDFGLSDLSNEQGRKMAFELNAALERGGQLRAHGSLQALPAMLLTAAVEAEQLSLATLQPYIDDFLDVSLESGTLSLSGVLAITPEQPFEYAGDLRLDTLEVVDRAQREALLSWNRLHIDKLAVRPNSLEISELQLIRPYTRIEVEQDGSTNLGRVLVERPDSNAQSSADGVPFTLLIGQTTIADGSARFTDQALPLPFEANISSIEGSLSTLSTASSKAARVTLEGQVNEYGHVQIGGTLNPFNPTVDSDIQIGFENVDMPRVSPYTIKFAGRKIREGRTDLDLNYRVTDGMLEGSNHLVVHDLTLGEHVEHPDAVKLPLDLAVALLKDPNGKVDLDFPVTGSLDDPQFSYAGAILTALGNVLRNLVTAPFRLLGALVGLEAEDLEQVSFLPGRSDLTPPQRETLDQLAGALNQRPQLHLTMPPVTDPVADRRALSISKVDTEIDRLVAETSADERNGEDDMLLTERRQGILERLYDERALLPPRDELRGEHIQPDQEGDSLFDPVAYAEALRTALIEAAEIPDTELTQLANKRAAAVMEQLSASGELAADRISELAAVQVVMDQDGQIHMPLTVSVQN